MEHTLPFSSPEVTEAAEDTSPPDNELLSFDEIQRMRYKLGSPGDDAPPFQRDLSQRYRTRTARVLYKYCGD